MMGLRGRDNGPTTALELTVIRPGGIRIGPDRIGAQVHDHFVPTLLDEWHDRLDRVLKDLVEVQGGLFEVDTAIDHARNFQKVAD